MTLNCALIVIVSDVVESLSQILLGHQTANSMPRRAEMQSHGGEAPWARTQATSAGRGCCCDPLLTSARSAVCAEHCASAHICVELVAGQLLARDWPQSADLTDPVVPWVFPRIAVGLGMGPSFGPWHLEVCWGLQGKLFLTPKSHGKSSLLR